MDKFLNDKSLTSMIFDRVKYKCMQKQNFEGSETQVGSTVAPIGPDELPPSYQASQGSTHMVTCRVCQAMIDISGKRDQHVVKCSQCNEATVSNTYCFGYQNKN